MKFKKYPTLGQFILHSDENKQMMPYAKTSFGKPHLKQPWTNLLSEKKSILTTLYQILRGLLVYDQRQAITDLSN